MLPYALFKFEKAEQFNTVDLVLGLKKALMVWIIEKMKTLAQCRSEKALCRELHKRLNIERPVIITFRMRNFESILLWSIVNNFVTFISYLLGQGKEGTFQDRSFSIWLIDFNPCYYL